MRKVTAAVIAAACLVPAAFAATPAKKSSFAWCTSKDVCPMKFDTNRTGKRLVNFGLYSKCATVPPAEGWPTFRVRNGKFSKKGSFKDVIGQTIQFKVAGKFVTRRKAVGTFDIDRAGCSDKERKFTAKRRGAAGG
jgi:hypothetical protein